MLFGLFKFDVVKFYLIFINFNNSKLRSLKFFFEIELNFIFKTKKSKKKMQTSFKFL